MARGHEQGPPAREEVVVSPGDRFDADSPRGVRRVRVEALEADRVPPLAEVVEVCTHATAVAGLCGCVPSPRFTIALTWHEARWRMPAWYRVSP